MRVGILACIAHMYQPTFFVFMCCVIDPLFMSKMLPAAGLGGLEAKCLRSVCKQSLRKQLCYGSYKTGDLGCERWTYNQFTETPQKDDQDCLVNFFMVFRVRPFDMTCRPVGMVHDPACVHS